MTSGSPVPSNVTDMTDFLNVSWWTFSGFSWPGKELRGQIKDTDTLISNWILELFDPRGRANKKRRRIFEKKEKKSQALHLISYPVCGLG